MELGTDSASQQIPYREETFGEDKTITSFERRRRKV